MEVLNNTVIKILQIVKNWAIPMYEIWGNNKNQMVNQKQLKEKKKSWYAISTKAKGWSG